MMNRRELLRGLLALPIAATFDVEKLLWVPGQMVTVPSTLSMSYDGLLAVTIQKWAKTLEQQLTEQSAFHECLRRDQIAVEEWRGR